MKLIQVPNSPDRQPGDTAAPHEATALMQRAQENRLRVIEAALAIEDRLTSLLAHYFFHDAPEQRGIFTSLVLNSDWCSFASKRKLLKHLVNLNDWIIGEEKNEFDYLLRDVMSFRNAFTHGMLAVHGRGVRLNFFEGGPQERDLTDEFLTEMEGKLRTAYQGILALLAKVGAPAHR